MYPFRLVSVVVSAIVRGRASSIPGMLRRLPRLAPPLVSAVVLAAGVTACSEDVTSRWEVALKEVNTPVAKSSPTLTPVSPSPTATTVPSPTPVRPSPTAVWVTVPPTPSVKPTPLRPPLLLDVPGWMGKSIADLETGIGKPFLVGPVRPDAFGSAGGYGKSRSYKQDWGVLEVLVVNDRIGGLLFRFLGMAPPNADSMFLQMGLPAGQKPSRTAPTEKVWDNVNGLTVKIVTEEGAAGKIVYAVAYRPR